jgi:hypothetical protein
MLFHLFLCQVDFFTGGNVFTEYYLLLQTKIALLHSDKAVYYHF